MSASDGAACEAVGAGAADATAEADPFAGTVGRTATFEGRAGFCGAGAIAVATGMSDGIGAVGSVAAGAGMLGSSRWAVGSESTAALGEALCVVGAAGFVRLSSATDPPATSTIARHAAMSPPMRAPFERVPFAFETASAETFSEEIRAGMLPKSGGFLLEDGTAGIGVDAIGEEGRWPESGASGNVRSVDGFGVACAGLLELYPPAGVLFGM